MNNSTVSDYLETEVRDNLPMLRQQLREMTDIVEALEKVSQSNYWILLEDKIFSNEINLLRNLLSKEKDTIEIYRLQGQITRAEKYSFDKMITDYRNKLLNIKNKIKS